MRQESVSYLSWDTRVLPLDGEAFVFPAILRKRSHKYIFEAYMREPPSGHQELDRFSRASFYRIVNALAAGGSRPRKAVDYVTGFLVNDYFAVIKQIVNTLSLHGDVRSDIEKDIEIARAYLKYGFDWKTRAQLQTVCFTAACTGLTVLFQASNRVQFRTALDAAACSASFGACVSCCVKTMLLRL